jgi:hypothetical protein
MLLVRLRACLAFRGNRRSRRQLVSGDAPIWPECLFPTRLMRLGLRML